MPLNQTLAVVSDHGMHYAGRLANRLRSTILSSRLNLRRRTECDAQFGASCKYRRQKWMTMTLPLATTKIVTRTRSCHSYARYAQYLHSDNDARLGLQHRLYLCRIIPDKRSSKIVCLSRRFFGSGVCNPTHIVHLECNQTRLARL